MGGWIPAHVLFPFFKIDGKLRFDCLGVAEWVVKHHKVNVITCRCGGKVNRRKR